MAGIDQYTTLMLHMDGTDGSTTFTDDSEKGHTVTPTLAEIDTAQSVFGGASGLFNSATSRLTITDDDSSFNLGSQDFVFDWRMKLSTLTGTQALITQWGGGGSNGSIYIVKLTGSNKLSFFYSPNGSSEVQNDSTYNIPDTNWHWYSIARSGNTLRFYVDGTQYGSADMTGVTINNSSRPFNISTYADGTGQPFSGWIDELRVSVGTDRGFTGSTITVPTEAYSGQLTAEIDDTVTLADEWQILTNQFEADIDETLTIDDNFSIILSKTYLSIADSLTLDDTFEVLLSVVNATLDDTITLSDDFNVATTELVSYASQILHYNPLIFVTDTDPIKLVSIDISVPEIPVKSVYTLTGYSGASDIALNETLEYFYITVDGAKVLKIEKADLNNVTEIDTIDTNNLLNIDTLDDFFTSYASTDYATGEIIKIDEREIKKFNSDVRWLEEKITRFATRLNTILGKCLNADLRFIANQTKKLRVDLRWINTQYSSINDNPIDFTDIQILINGVDMVPLNDIDMETIQIVHTIDEKSQASFRLSRRHDQLDVTNTGVASQITNNNAVVIIIDGHTEFSGKVSSISAESENEAVIVTAKMNTPSTLMNTVNIPLSSLNENISLYDCMVNDLVIDEPYVDPTDENPEYYKGIKIQLGTHIEQVVSGGRLIEIIMDNQGYYATQIEDGTFLIKPGFTYFWRVDFINFITGTKRSGLGTYIGTSLGSLSTDTYKITAVSPIWQKVRDDIEIELDEWTIGEAPFQEISVKNGKKIVKGKYSDSTGGLYYGTDESYNYIPYAIEVAQLEYEKLQNINGDILPIVSNTIDVTLDAYYYYKLKLLSRINVSNTTTSNIYKNNNGFPVAVKSITITINTNSRMMVSLQCDNQKSLQELEAIDARYPDENSDEYIVPESYKLITQKYDLASLTDGGFFNFPDLPTDDVFQAIMDKIESIWPSSS